jgi:hypothetical protein
MTVNVTDNLRRAPATGKRGIGGTGDGAVGEAGIAKTGIGGAGTGVSGKTNVGFGGANAGAGAVGKLNTGIGGAGAGTAGVENTGTGGAGAEGFAKTGIGRAAGALISKLIMDASSMPANSAIAVFIVSCWASVSGISAAIFTDTVTGPCFATA